MLQPIITWPSLELTDEERQYVAHYGNPKKPGVLRRTYTARLIQSTVATGPQSQNTQQVNFSGRRVRVFGLTFSGDIQAWKLTIRNPAGTLYTTEAASVPAMLGYQEDLTTFAMVPQWRFTGVQPGDYLSIVAPAPLLFDPNIIIEGTDSLIFQGTLGQPWIDAANGQPYRAVLNICVHCWEFPEFPRERPFLSNKTGRVQSRKVSG
jgi:hypothetical protein